MDVVRYPKPMRLRGCLRAFRSGPFLPQEAINIVSSNRRPSEDTGVQGNSVGTQTGRALTFLRRRAVLLTALPVITCLAPTPHAQGDTPAEATKKAPPAAARTAVQVKVDGGVQRGSVEATTVKGALEELGIELGKLDRVAPAAVDALKPGQTITVTRVQHRQVAEAVPLPPGTDFQYSKALRAGLRKTLRLGKPGTKERLYEVWTKDGKETVRKLVGERVAQEPENAVVLIGARQSFVSRGMPRPRKVLIMEATGYSPGPKSCGKYANGWTACGIRAQHGVVAVDPRVIPFGTRLYVEGYGYAIAADTGSAIKGMKIDLCHPTHERALKEGRKKVKVYLLD